MSPAALGLMSGATCEMSCEPTPLLDWEPKAAPSSQGMQTRAPGCTKAEQTATISDPHTAGGSQSHGRAGLRAAQQFRRASQEATAACGTQALLQSERAA